MFDYIPNLKIKTKNTGWNITIKLWKANANLNDQNDNDQQKLENLNEW